MPDIDHVSLTFGNGVKRAEYDPIKKCEVTISARVGENEDGVVILAQIGTIAIAKVADLLSAPKPETSGAVAAAAEPAEEAAPPKRKPGRPPKEKDQFQEQVAESAHEEAPAAQPAGVAPPADEEWTAPAAKPEITDEVLLKSSSAAAERLGGKDKVKTLIQSFATRTEGAPFKVQEIAQAQRQDYLDKLAALT